MNSEIPQEISKLLKHFDDLIEKKKYKLVLDEIDLYKPYYGNLRHFLCTCLKVYFLTKNYIEVDNLLTKLINFCETENQNQNLLQIRYQNYKNQYLDPKYKPPLYNPVLQGKFITITMTTCKRLSLFITTVNSMIINITDLNLVSEWIVIDDNSSESDRNIMRSKFPFIRFIWKSEVDSGHARSLNILFSQVETPYVFHVEDDWKFITKQPYLSMTLNVLLQNNKYGQCLINQHYTETLENWDWEGGKICSLKQNLNLSFNYIEHVNNTENVKKGCSYWPHFSLRPSLFRSDCLRLKKFSEDPNIHFELDYAHIYFHENQYLSCFLQGINTIHIGKLTSDKYGYNAYFLNNQPQFGANTFLELPPLTIINLNQRRYDRRIKMDSQLKPYYDKLTWSYYPAVDGKKINNNHQFYQLFDNNDYNYRTGMVGCALSHIHLWMSYLIKSKDKETPLIVLEDDVKICEKFDKKLSEVVHAMRVEHFDLLMIGHFPRQNNTKLSNIRLIQKQAFQALSESLGGTIGYMVTKKGCHILLTYIEEVGMTNCIDTMMQKCGDRLRLGYIDGNLENQLITSECFDGKNKNSLDTDIQFEYSNYAVDLFERLKKENQYLTEQNIVFNTVKTSILSKQDYENNFIYSVGIMLSNVIAKDQITEKLLIERNPNKLFVSENMKDSLISLEKILGS